MKLTLRKMKKDFMKTVPAIDPVTLSNPNVQEAATRAELATADALAAARQARVAKARLKAARKTHKQAKKTARKSAKRNRKAQAFLKSLLAKTQARELLKPTETGKRLPRVEKLRTVSSKKTKPVASRPARSPQPKRPTGRRRGERTETGTIRVSPGASAPVLVAASPMGMSSSGTGGEGSGGT